MSPLTRYRIFGIFFLVVNPFVLIWSLNTLFNLGIPFSFKTWLAGLLLIHVVKFQMGVGKHDYSLLIRDSKAERVEELEKRLEELGAMGKRIDEEIETLENEIERREARQSKKKSRS
jgi:hypothetical protein